jgi:hypothetical protein
MQATVEEQSFPSILEMMFEGGLKKGVSVDILLAPDTVWDDWGTRGSAESPGYRSYCDVLGDDCKMRREGVVTGYVAMIDYDKHKLFLSNHWDCLGKAGYDVKWFTVEDKCIFDYTLRETKFDLPVRGLVGPERIETMYAQGELLERRVPAGTDARDHTCVRQEIRARNALQSEERMDVAPWAAFVKGMSHEGLVQTPWGIYHHLSAEVLCLLPPVNLRPSSGQYYTTDLGFHAEHSTFMPRRNAIPEDDLKPNNKPEGNTEKPDNQILIN